MNRENRRNYYRVLQVQPDAPTEVIKASYRALMQKLRYHPDLGGDVWNATLINEAYAVLSDPQRRRDYDSAQADLARQVGAKSRVDETLGESTAGPTNEPCVPTPNPAAPARVWAEIAKTQTRACAFCGTANPAAGYEHLEFCGRCHATLKPVVTTKHSAGRAAGRIEHSGAIHFVLDWPASAKHTAAVIDLSPTGIQIMSPLALELEQKLKLESPSLNAVAIVSRCQPDRATSGFRTGAQFLTLHLQKTSGTFFSASV